MWKDSPIQSALPEEEASLPIREDGSGQAALGIPGSGTNINTNTTYSLSKSGSTITLKGSDGSTTSVTDSNTTYSLSSFSVNASAAELNYVKGVMSGIQTQLNSKVTTSDTAGTVAIQSSQPSDTNIKLWIQI